MYCQNCGKEIEEGALFCMHCGTSVQDDRPKGAQTAAEKQPTDGREQKQSPKKGKMGVIIAVVSAVLLLAAGAVGGILYFTGDGYVSRKNLRLAKESYAEEEYTDAISYCKEALERDPTLTDAWLLYADILLAQEKYEEAVKNLEKGLKRVREDEEAQRLLTDKIDEVNRAEAAQRLPAEEIDEGNGTETETEPATETETATAAARFQEYLEQELAPQYGYARLNSKVKEFDVNVWDEQGISKEDVHWTSTEGIVFVRICDWDGDGRDELLTLIQEGYDRKLCVYELEDETVVEKAECPVEQSDDLSERDESWTLLDAEGGKYLYSSLTFRSAVADYSYAWVRLYRYDGEQLYTPLTLEYRTDSSRSDCWAYQYNESGELLSEESVYSYLHDGPDQELRQDRGYCEGRITELSAEYGIAWDSDKNLPSAGNGDEELARFRVWYELKNSNTYVFHFDGWDSSHAVYEAFLQGEKTLRMRGDLGSAWFNSGREEWTFRDILESMEHSYLGYGAGEISRVEYAFMDCGGDGKEELMLRFLWEGPDQDSFATWDDGARIAVIFCRNGELELVYLDETWSEAFVEIDYYGCINSSISLHRGNTMSEQRYIDGNGELQTVYTKEELWEEELSYEYEAAYKEAFAGISGYMAGVGVAHYEINGEAYYVLYDWEDREECRHFVSLCEQEGKRFVAEDEMESLLAGLVGQRLAELGVDEMWKTGNGLRWNTLQTEAADQETDKGNDNAADTETDRADRKLAKEIRHEGENVEEYNYVYMYDGNGRVTERILYRSDGTRSFTVVYQYDEQGNLTEEFGSSGEEFSSSYDYYYDSFGRVAKEWRRYYGDIEYIYDDQGKLIEEIHYADYLYFTDQGGATHWYEYRYDEQGKLTGKIQYVSDAVNGMDREEYTFDERGNLTERIVRREDSAGTWNYRYMYSYDAQGNQTEEARYLDDGSLDGWTAYAYDSWGNLTKESYYDGDGSLGSWTEYVYE